jgi:hypothetical protein
MKYLVRRYYSSFVKFEIEAESEVEAYEKSKTLPIDINDLYNNLSDWADADEVEELDERIERK